MLLIATDPTQLSHALEDTVASRPGRGRVAIGPISAWRLGQSCQERRFAERQISRTLTEPGLCCRLHTTQITSVRSCVQVRLQDLIFGANPLEFECAKGLDHLGGPGTRSRFEHAAELHRNCARSR